MFIFFLYAHACIWKYPRTRLSGRAAGKGACSCPIEGAGRHIFSQGFAGFCQEQRFFYERRRTEQRRRGSGMEKRRLVRNRRRIYLGTVVLVILLNAAAWNSTAFSDWYIAHIFPLWVNTYGRVTGIFPFSVGEGLLGAGAVLIICAAVFGVLWIIIWIMKLARMLYSAGRLRKSDWPGRRPKDAAESFGAEARVRGIAEGARAAGGEKRREIRRFRRFSRGFGIFFAWTFLIVCLVMTLNCFVLYHASTFSEQYFGEDEGDYTLAELIRVYNLVAENCNRLAGVIERDESGMAVYTGSYSETGGVRHDGRAGDEGKAGNESRAGDYGPEEEKGLLLDMEDKARELMRRLGSSYPQLDGYYPRPKALWSSDFMCQQHMQGYYFPFSMEANYNDVMHILNKPATMCHELAHLRGYIYEDEANFISYLACVQSEDVFFQYAGYLSVLVYLNNDLYKAWEEERAAYEEAVEEIRPVTVDNRVWEDNLFVTEEEWERINGKALIDTEIVDKAADVLIDTNLKVNGIADGKISYSRVVRLLLQYYRGGKSAGFVPKRQDRILERHYRLCYNQSTKSTGKGENVS